MKNHIILCFFAILPGIQGCGSTSDAENDCRTAERFKKDCTEYGRCARPESSMGGTRCLAIKDGDCRASTIACKEMGRCGTSGDKKAIDCAVVSEDDCAKSKGCKEYGRCGMKKNSEGELACMPTKSTHCAASTRCAENAECHLRADQCGTTPG